ncbi:acetyl-CoA carboxylase biotin carboxylase subunit [Tamaricihabitans halophyticus]|uniref:acetyl-CoA carboxylase biotin carboxylase subunit n=1 Tax=Tamaricihabitans halophyticus TaxID=1262583 RepID=UPI001FB4F4CF|nr:acetyl-CoA carboxylase biotin carboxylase subunit [Tamaricihabitans halophyticus]
MLVEPAERGQRPVFDTVLVANRGEIALRVVRSCQEMGIRTVVVYSTADSRSAAVLAADEAVRIGPAAPRQSYLYAPPIIEAARATGAQAVHPGYGFLSEDPDFAEICARNGLVFIGPEPSAMRQLGDKSTARKIMTDAGLPVLPGTIDPVGNVGDLVNAANKIGLPLIIKAAAGGGGNGMAVVRDWADLVPKFRSTRSVARSVFGDERVYIERYLENTRHIEVQILADQHGNVVALGERDCSVQRRHQKLIEESPAARISPEIVDRLRELAVLGAREVGYTGAGTFEFLVQGEEIAFIEVNSRIQVEHPVTEMLTGVDLVREQVLIAAGRELSLRQQDVRSNGAAIECRVNAEDPDNGFVPRPGELLEFLPPGGPGIRVDTSAYAGWRIPAEYDSLVAKVIAWAPDRERALARMNRALREFRISGERVRTTRDALRAIIADPVFQEARHTTSFLEPQGP